MTTIFAPFDRISPDEFKRATEVTYLGCVYGTMAALKRMKPRDRGAIVQVGSALAFRSIPLQAPYCGAKHAIVGFTDSIRSELLHARSRVHITTVHLPGMNTRSSVGEELACLATRSRCPRSFNRKSPRGRSYGLPRTAGGLSGWAGPLTSPSAVRRSLPALLIDILRPPPSADSKPENSSLPTVRTTCSNLRRAITPLRASSAKGRRTRRLPTD